MTGGHFGKISILAVMAGLGLAASASSEPTTGYSFGSFGAPGLIDMPTAETRPAGEFSATVAARQGDSRAAFNFQIAPSLSGTLRFSESEDLGTGGSKLKDRSFDLHWQVFEEAGWRPAIALGLRDIVGDSGQSSEYLVATKTLTPRLRASVGLGWGRLGSEGGSGGTRPAPSGDGGFNADQWFRGPVAPFAGLSFAANDRLTLKAEISSDAYTTEVGNGFERKTSLNFGADYKVNKAVSLGAYLLHGSEIGLQATIAMDPRDPPAPSGLEKAPLPVRPRAAAASGWSGAWSADPTARPAIQKALGDALKSDGQILEAMKLTTTGVEIRLRNETYNARPQAIGHAARMLTRAMPASVENFTITLVEKGMPVSSTRLRRSDIEAMENGPAHELLARTEITEAGLGSDGFTAATAVYPRVKYAFSPYLELSSHEPGQSLRADAGLQAKAQIELTPGLLLSGTVRQKLVGNIADGSYSASGTSPAIVRSDINTYKSNSDLAVQNLTLAWYARPAENLYSRVTVGYLERMYGGISGELLWKPVDSRLALGAEIDYVKKRDYEQHFSFADYETVSGHLSAYYDFGEGITGQLDLGRYLAEDWGATIAVDRELANGWKVGAFATLTDMSSAEFGNGAFDKGIRLSIPLSWAIGQPSLATFNQTLRPYSGDGGARVDVDGRLYDTIRSGHIGELYQNWGRVWR
ncbi:YjbH domain-containing protein [Thioclava sp. A2]|uniref:YjbH domain-containing protein n=1 Tax=Thioclava sp. FCG-A2 TaxID=3080562 RepID=UPI00295421F2|nr:YjbH domain-containing protein [Thioclava sp. A2]MDV7271439.1 YjbH domain-containing protein [Thioclava sp. A2]